MTIELLNSLATTGTFLVIAATAIVALVQLRHANGSNQITALNALRETTRQADYFDAQHFVLTDLGNALLDPAFRHQFVNRSARTGDNQKLITKVITIGNFYDDVGLLIKNRLVDRALIVESFGSNVLIAWEKLSPMAAIGRRGGNRSLWEDFEYFAVLAQDWTEAHPHGSYPRGARRIDLNDDWLEADGQYAASLKAVDAAGQSPA